VLDLLREIRPPFSPEAVVAEFSQVLKSYRIRKVIGDRYGGEWPRERFQIHGISYEVSALPKSQLYLNLLPLLNSGRAELLDSPRLIAQLVGLERRTARGGRDSIDHAPNAHDDVANAAAGVFASLNILQDWSGGRAFSRSPGARWKPRRQPALGLSTKTTGRSPSKKNGPKARSNTTNGCGAKSARLNERSTNETITHRQRRLRSATRPMASPARGKLADLLRQVAQHEKLIKEHHAAADRLDDIIVTHRKARAALDEFDAQSAAAAAEWARASLKPNAPTVDGKRRLELLTDVAAAQENAAAAATARQEFLASINAESQAIAALEVAIKHTIAEVVAETAAGPLLEDLQTALGAVDLKQSRLQQALQTVIGIAHSGPLEVMKPTFVLMEGLAETFRTTAPPAVDTGFADRAAWERFATNLRTDAGAELEGV
jgi:hypothetical protein